jgi:hypothetical protein
VKHSLVYLLVFTLGLSSCNERFDFDVPGAAGDPASGAGGASTAAGAGGLGSAAHCEGDADCPIPTMRCDLSTGACFQCVADGDCSASESPRCDSTAHRCVECDTDQSCGAGLRCDLVSRRCLPACDSEGACPASYHECDERRGVCVECDEDHECDDLEGGPYCLLGGAGCGECRLDEHCLSGQRCDTLRGRCVGCVDSRDCPSGSACDPTTQLCVEY